MQLLTSIRSLYVDHAEIGPALAFAPWFSLISARRLQSALCLLVTCSLVCCRSLEEDLELAPKDADLDMVDLHRFLTWLFLCINIIALYTTCPGPRLVLVIQMLHPQGTHDDFLTHRCFPLSLIISEAVY